MDEDDRRGGRFVITGWRTLLRLVPYLKRRRTGLAFGLTALILKDVAGAAIPLVVRHAIDQLSAGAGIRAILTICCVLIGVAALKGIFQFTMRVVLIGISRDVEYDLRNDLFKHLISLSPDFFQRQRTGDIMARATNDLNAVRMMVGPGLMYWTETSLTFILAVAIMMRFDWQLALLAILPAPAVSLAVMYFGRKIHDRFERIQELFSDISSRVQENFSAVRMVRAYIQERAESRRFEDLNRHYIEQNIKLARISGVFQPMLEGLMGLTFLIVLYAGGMRVLDGRLSLGLFVMFNTYMAMLIWPMIALGWVVNLMQRGTASMKRINELFEQKPSIAAPQTPAALPAGEADIEFCGVSVIYASGAALDNISLRIRRGTTVAIVGHTGSGKTTLVQLIPRLLDPTSGSVRYGGIEVREYHPEELRRRIGFVPQETFLFSETIAGNIAFGVEEATREQIEQAAGRAGIADDIASFPQGYETMVGERGITLSGGQKQRTAIARALLRDPEILILDDALSSVDNLTEERILTSLAAIMRGRTVILISHRVSTVRRADWIYVLEKGRVAEQGTHAQLIESGGLYEDLYQKQLLEEELDVM
jgi:ATP-binding cassette subfamily B protein